MTAFGLSELKLEN